MNDDRRFAFRFDYGADWLNLLATVSRRSSARPIERLTDPGRLREWLDRCELGPLRAPDDADLVRARDLRETLRELALAAVTGGHPPRGAAEDLAAFLDGRSDPIRLRLGDRLLRDAPATTDTALACITRQAVDQLTGTARHALKVCPEDDCHGVFADPGGRRRWCPAPACASRGRVRALRERRRASGRRDMIQLSPA